MMEIEIDLNPSPTEEFFISVSINDKEAISFDNTYKGCRAIKQVLIDKKSFPTNEFPTSEWDVLVFDNRKFVRKYHAKWVDMGKNDWVNDEMWETVRSKKISQKLRDKLLYYSQLFSDNYENLENFSGDFRKFEELIEKEIVRLCSDWC